MTRWHIIFSGKVQGVGFRYTACVLARELCLTGWVSNLSDGRVEMEAQGDAGLLRRLVDGLKSQRYISVDHAQIDEIGTVPDERYFDVRGY